MFCIQKNKAFTLAEVLITLGIIGIIAALTIPSLIKKNNEIETVSKLKKVYSTLLRAYSLAVLNNGSIENWNIDNSQTGWMRLYSIITPYLLLSKECKQLTNSGCWSNGSKNMPYNFETHPYPAKAILADGTSIAFRSDLPQFFKGQIFVDINGPSPPNELNKDCFTFEISTKGLYPPKTNPVSNCTNDPWATCAAWAIYIGNIDYLYCDDLSWNGKSRCN